MAVDVHERIPDAVQVSHHDKTGSTRIRAVPPGDTGTGAAVGLDADMAAASTMRRTWALAPVLAPVVGAVVLLASWERDISMAGAIGAAVALAAAVLASVHHAEVIAHKVGEPYGSLALAVAVTVVEVGLIVSLMSTGGPKAAGLARDTVFAAVMITCNGILAVCLLAASGRRRVTLFNAQGSGAALATVATLTTLTLVLATFTTNVPGPQFNGVQLAFAAIASLVIYAVFVVTQAGRHRDFFLPVEDDGEDPSRHAEPPSGRATARSLVLLMPSLCVVIGLAKVESPFIEAAVSSAGLQQGIVGVVIALLVLLPETIAAYRAARRRRTQVAVNLAYGSAMASIGLTIPAVAIASIWLDGPLLLGLGPTQLVLFALTMAVGVLTVVPGRATRLQGSVHLASLAAFLVGARHDGPSPRVDRSSSPACPMSACLPLRQGRWGRSRSELRVVPGLESARGRPRYR